MILEEDILCQSHLVLSESCFHVIDMCRVKSYLVPSGEEIINRLDSQVISVWVWLPEYCPVIYGRAIRDGNAITGQVPESSGTTRL